MKDLFLLPVKPVALRKAKIVHNFGLSECNRVNATVAIVRWAFFFTPVSLSVHLSIRNFRSKYM